MRNFTAASRAFLIGVSILVMAPCAPSPRTATATNLNRFVCSGRVVSNRPRWSSAWRADVGSAERSRRHAMQWLQWRSGRAHKGAITDRHAYQMRREAAVKVLHLESPLEGGDEQSGDDRDETADNATSFLRSMSLSFRDSAFGRM